MLPASRRRQPRPLAPSRARQSPLLLVALFGVYCAVQLLWGVATFRTVPEEAELLTKVRMWLCVCVGGGGRAAAVWRGSALR